MNDRIKTALVSVHDKSGLLELARFLQQRGVSVISTGGTALELRRAGLAVREIQEITGFPEILAGRVKTLHPAVHAGILARRDHPEDMACLRERSFPLIDLVVVNLYPFAARVAAGCSFAEALEEIDIGGVTLIRAAAKNFSRVGVVVTPADYPLVMDEMDREDETLSLITRLDLARKAFDLTTAYDAQIGAYLQSASCDGTRCHPPDAAGPLPAHLGLTLRREKTLRYGENPHQQAALYTESAQPAAGWAQVEQLHGKELSYNNYMDMDAACGLVGEFESCACAIIKHTNPCGAAVADSGVQAFQRALAADPDSAFGSIIAFNRPLTAICAREMSRLFLEVVIAPDFEPEALELLFRKRDLRIVRKPFGGAAGSALRFRTIDGAFLVQTADCFSITEKDMRVVTIQSPAPREMDDLLFAWRCVKHVKSNAIVLARDGQLLGVGAGQMSRVDAARLAIGKSRQPLSGAVMASDAFIPFRDTLDAAAAAGVTAVIETGGSIRDEEVIAAANERSLGMVFTGIRHFLH